MTAAVPMALSVTQFAIEGSSGCFYDWVRVNGGQKYCGTSGPNGVQLAAGEFLEWRSDTAVS